MKARQFIDKYLSQCDDTIVCLHSSDNSSETIFTIHDWRNSNTDEPINEPDLECEVSQIRAEVENYHYNLAVVIHIFIEYHYEEAK